MSGKIAGILSRKVMVTALLLVFAVVATAGGIKYYRYKAVQTVVQSKTFQTAEGVLGLEGFPKLALSQEQAQKLLPVVRELVAKPQKISNDAAKAQAMLEVLNSEQKDFIKNLVIPSGAQKWYGFRRNRPVRGIQYLAGNAGNNLGLSQDPKGTSTLSLSQQEKGVLLPILKEISQKPNADDTYLTQQAVEIKAVLIAAGVQNASGETNNVVFQQEQRKGHFLANRRPDKGSKNRDGRFEGPNWLTDQTGAGVYDYLLQVLLQKAYS